VEEIVLVTRQDALDKAADLCREYGVSKVEKVIIGGKNRNESALAGLSAIKRGARLVLIHDGARPLVTEKVIYDAMHAAALYKCAAPAVAVTDTVKEKRGDVVERTLDRDRLMAIQTPQAFVPEIIKAALTTAVREEKEYTDDCAAVEAMGVRVHLSEGSYENIKITRPVDIQTAEAILRDRHE
jgi:2-C-methyl-D-erythritol 4-phosphate cytidylyltransferase